VDEQALAIELNNLAGFEAEAKAKRAELAALLV
jgi:hypothetical protein